MSNDTLATVLVAAVVGLGAFAAWLWAQLSRVRDRYDLLVTRINDLGTELRREITDSRHRTGDRLQPQFESFDDDIAELRKAVDGINQRTTKLEAIVETIQRLVVETIQRAVATFQSKG